MTAAFDTKTWIDMTNVPTTEAEQVVDEQIAIALGVDIQAIYDANHAQYTGLVW
jgi:hypothetical protein